MDPYGLWWKGLTGGFLAGLGGKIALSGIASANPIVAGIGIGMAAVGGGLLAWQILDIWPTAEACVEPIKDAQAEKEQKMKEAKRLGYPDEDE